VEPDDCDDVDGEDLPLSAASDLHGEGEEAASDAARGGGDGEDSSAAMPHGGDRDRDRWLDAERDRCSPGGLDSTTFCAGCAL
jgi:hypothetical protein